MGNLSYVCENSESAERFDFLRQSAETEIAKERDGRRPVDAARSAGVPIDHKRHAIVEPHQFAAQQRLFAVSNQILLELRAFHFRRMFKHRVERAELFEQLPGGLRTDLRHAGHVIDRIAHQRLKIDHLLRRDSPIVLSASPGR